MKTKRSGCPKTCTIRNGKDIFQLKDNKTKQKCGSTGRVKDARNVNVCVTVKDCVFFVSFHSILRKELTKIKLIKHIYIF